MVLLIQVFGALFGLFLMYLAFINLKKREFSLNEWAFWTLVAASFAIISLFPEVLNPFVRTLNISRKMDFLIIIGFMLIIGVVFYTYRATMRTQKKIEEVVRRIAIDEAEKGKEKRSNPKL